MGFICDLILSSAGMTRKDMAPSHYSLSRITCGWDRAFPVWMVTSLLRMESHPFSSLPPVPSPKSVLPPPPKPGGQGGRSEAPPISLPFCIPQLPPAFSQEAPWKPSMDPTGVSSGNILRGPLPSHSSCRGRTVWQHGTHSVK